MKNLATTTAALAFTASAALAQENGAASKGTPLAADEPVAHETAPEVDPPEVIWEGNNLKIFAYDDENGLANMFILTCPHPEFNNSDIELYLYDLPQFDLFTLKIDSKKEAWKAAKSGFSDEYPSRYSDGLLNSDGSVIAAYSHGQFVKVVEEAFALPTLPPSAPIAQENVLQHVRSFALNFCFGMS